MFEAPSKTMFLARCFLGWDCFGVHKAFIKTLIPVERRAMTVTEGEDALMLFVVIGQLLKHCGAIRNFDHPFAFALRRIRTFTLSPIF